MSVPSQIFDERCAGCGERLVFAVGEIGEGEYELELLAGQPECCPHWPYVLRAVMQAALGLEPLEDGGPF